MWASVWWFRKDDGFTFLHIILDEVSYVFTIYNKEKY